MLVTNILNKKVSDYLQSGDVPHLLFFGKGKGKTTLKLIVNSIDCDYIIINENQMRTM